MKRAVQMTGEAAALAVVVPFSFALAANPRLSKRARVLAGTIGAVSLVVDGWLLLENMQNFPVNR